MILLECVNQAIQEQLLERMNFVPTEDVVKPPALEFKVSDFDGAIFHVASDEKNPSVVNISLQSIACKSLLDKGGADLLKTVYGAHFVSPQGGYDVTLSYDVDAVAQGDRVKIATEIAKLKTHLYGSVVLRVCEAAEKGQVGKELIDIPLRDTQERMWLRADSTDRVTVIFSINFVDADDVVFGKVFLQEFKKNVTGAPTVDFTVKNPPLELKDVKDAPKSDNIGYVTFVIYDRHFKGDKKHSVAENLPTFRNYLHYHIKCCKSNLHTRMRNRVDLLLQILNRAKQDLDSGEKKTAKGRTFVKK
jgi:actin related protein 2/3 complex subunit 2